MRELNKKIFEIAAITSPNEEVNISQLLTDNLVNEIKLENSSKPKKPDQEAMKIIEEERKKIISPSNTININRDKTSTSLNLKPSTIKMGAKENLTKSSDLKNNPMKGNYKSKKNIKSNKAWLPLMLALLIAGIAYYLYTELF